MDEVSDLLRESKQDKEECKKWKRPKDEGNSSPSRSPVAIAFETDPGADGHIQNPGKGSNNKSNRPVRSVKMVELKWYDRGGYRFHDLKAEVPPEQPSKKECDAHFGIGESADAVSVADRS